jgi:hypothetical protein
MVTGSSCCRTMLWAEQAGQADVGGRVRESVASASDRHPQQAKVRESRENRAAMRVSMCVIN